MANSGGFASCAENARPKRFSALSHLKSYTRRFSSSRSPQLSSNANPTLEHSGLHRAFIALGSNIGDRVEMIEKACLELDRANIKVKRTSSLFETTPMYVLDQDTFINGVCEVRFSFISCFLLSQILKTRRSKRVSRQWSYWTSSSLLKLSWDE